MKSMIILVTLILSMACATAVCAQNCNNAIVATTPTSRFVDNGNGTVTDIATGLTWKRCSEGQIWNGTTCTGSATTLAWQGALQAGNDAVFAGTSDWRLPNKNELASLVENQCNSPAINEAVFPATPSSSHFWSSSPYAGGSDDAWGVGFGSGGVGYDRKYGELYLRLVRGGQ